MDFNQSVNYYENKKLRQKALEVAARCNPGNGKMIARGVRGIDLHPVSYAPNPNEGKKKCNHEYVIKLHLEGKTQKELSEIFGVSKQNISYIILRYNKANGITNIKPDRESIIDKTGKLFYNEGRTHNEIAEIMECEKKTVIKRVSVYKKRYGK